LGNDWSLCGPAVNDGGSDQIDLAAASSAVLQMAVQVGPVRLVLLLGADGAQRQKMAVRVFIRGKLRQSCGQKIVRFQPGENW
jgi:hypothetical protein